MSKKTGKAVLNEKIDTSKKDGMAIWTNRVYLALPVVFLHVALFSPKAARAPI